MEIKYSYVENTCSSYSYEVINNVIVFLSEQIPGAVIRSVNIIMHVFCVGGSKLNNMYHNL